MKEVFHFLDYLIGMTGNTLEMFSCASTGGDCGEYAQQYQFGERAAYGRSVFCMLIVCFWHSFDKRINTPTGRVWASLTKPKRGQSCKHFSVTSSPLRSRTAGQDPSPLFSSFVSTIESGIGAAFFSAPGINLNPSCLPFRLTLRVGYRQARAIVCLPPLSPSPLFLVRFMSNCSSLNLSTR